jgi:hypothetical protein
MFKARRRLIVALIAVALGVSAGVASGFAVRHAGDASSEEARSSEVQGPVWEALVPPVAPTGGWPRM